MISAEELASTNPDKLKVSRYLSYFCEPDSPGYQYVIDWVNNIVPQHSIINFSSDWLDGLALCSLVNTFLPGTITDEEALQDMSPSERVTYIMNAAEQELNITQLVKPDVFVAEDAEQLWRMAYVTQFIHLKPQTPELSPVAGDDVEWLTSSVSAFYTSSDEAIIAPSNEDIHHIPVASEFDDPQIEFSEMYPEFNENEVLEEKYELPVHTRVPFQDQNEILQREKDIEEGRDVRQKRKSELDELFAAIELDFDIALKEIDEIGKTPEVTPTLPTKNKTEAFPAQPVSTVTSSTPATQLNELELDFEFSSDSEETSNAPSHSPSPEVHTKDEIEAKTQDNETYKYKDEREDEEEIEQECEPMEDHEEVIEEKNELVEEKGELKKEHKEKRYEEQEIEEKQEEKIDLEVLASQEEEVIEVAYTTELRYQLSATTSPEPVSEHSTSVPPSSLSPSPPPPQVTTPVDPQPIQEVPQEEDKGTMSPCYPNQCVVQGKGLQCGIVNHPAEFIVDCSKAGRGRLEIVIEGPNGENLEATGEQLKGSVYKLAFTPIVVGTHKISVLFSEEDVPNSPFLCQVSNPLACIAAGNGLHSCTLGQEIRFQVDTAKAGPGTLQATFTATFDGKQQPSQFKLISCLDGVFTYCYVVDKPGDYIIDITWVGQHIKGSPFQVTALPFRPNACALLGYPIDRVQVGSNVEIKVDTSKAGHGELKAILLDPNGERICNVSVDDSKVYTISAQPCVIGEHYVLMQYGGEEIPRSPFRFNVNDPTRVIVDDVASVLSQPVLINKTIAFSVDTKNCGEGLLSTKVTTPDGVDHAQIQRDSNSLCYNVSYVPKTQGTYSIELFIDNHPCLSTPLQLSAINVPQSISDIVLTRTLPSQGSHYLLNKTMEFHVHAPNRDSTKLKMVAVGTRTGSQSQPYINIISNGDDKYTLQFRATRSDDYKISVTYDNMHLIGSPFVLPIRSPPRASKVSMYDPVIPLKADQPLELVFDTSQAGEGTLSASSVNSKSHNMPTYVEQVDDGMYRIAFIPQISDTFMVSVLYAGKHVNGSPFRVLYKEQIKPPSVCIFFEPDMSVKGLMGAAVYGRNTGRQEATVVQYKRGKYQISFYPSRPDVFDLHIYWFDEEVEGSPFEMDLLGVENESSESLVDTIPLVSGNKVGMLAATAVGRTTGPVPVHLAQTEDFSCNVEFTTQIKDTFDINLFWNGKSISGMPIHLSL